MNTATLFKLLVLALVLVAVSCDDKTIPPRIRVIGNAPDQDGDLYLCIFNANGKVADIEVKEKELSSYTKVDTGDYTLSVANKSSCASDTLIPDYDNATVTISTSMLASVNFDKTLTYYNEGFTAPTQNNMTQVFVLVQKLTNNDTNAVVNFTIGQNTTSIATFGLPFSDSFTTPKGDYDISVQTLPSNTIKTKNDEELEGGEYFTFIVNYDLSFDIDQNDGSSGGNGWILWTVLGVVIGVILLIAIVVVVIVFLRFQRRKNYANV